MEDPDNTVVLRQFVRKDTGCCTYLFGASGSDECVLVDPLLDYERFIPGNSLSGRESRVKYVIDTHVHADHLSGAREICKATGAELMMHESASISQDFSRLRDGMNFTLCGLDVTVLHTPGHAPEHISLLVDNRALLSGDALLIGDVGRTDLGRGNNEDLHRSLFKKLMALDDGVEVHPAHVGAQHYLSGDLSSTVGIERRSNPALQVKTADEFARYMTQGWPPKPADYELYVEVNRGLLTLEEAQGRLAKAAIGEA